MPLNDTLNPLCFAHDGVILVPAETLGESGIDAPMADQLIAPGRLSGRQLQCLEHGFALYWRRARDLFARAPGSWCAPHRTNLLLVTEPTAVPPYFDPFAGTSSQLYVSDLDTNAEFVAYLLVHNDRIGRLHSLRAALICNLSYWLALDEVGLQAFCRGALRARRPDAPIFVALADALAWIPALFHHPLRPPAPGASEPCLHVDEADLLVPERLKASLLALCARAEASLHLAMAEAVPRRQPATAAAVDQLCGWIQQCRAHVIVQSDSGDALWSPGHDNPEALRCELRHADEAALASLWHDLRVTHERTRALLDSLVDPGALPRHCRVLLAGDGVYLDAASHAIVYQLRQPGFDTRDAPAPPFHRLLLGARVLHEWGHLAHTARLIRVPEDRQGRYELARAELGRQFMRVVANVPRRLRADVLQELQMLAPNPHDWPTALARKTLSRVGDYLANLLCSHFLPADEMQAYVRANVRSHLAENLGLLGELARYAHELQYLALAGMPRSYFFDITQFNDYFVDTGIVSEEDALALFDATARVFACYSIDESRLKLPTPPCVPEARTLRHAGIAG